MYMYVYAGVVLYGCSLGYCIQRGYYVVVSICWFVNQQDH